MSRFIDRTGMRFGRLTLLEFLGKPEGKTKACWRCRCECGNVVIATTSNLITGHTQSCGCLLVESGQQRRIYAKEDSPEYIIWRGMKQRAGKTKGKNATWYAGILMSPAWHDSFEVFLSDMGKRPSPEHSIERLDNTKGYFPENCVWATAETQANNRRTNRIVEHQGEQKTVAQWAKQTGLRPHTLYARLFRYGWDTQAALTTPVK